MARRPRLGGRALRLRGLLVGVTGGAATLPRLDRGLRLLCRAPAGSCSPGSLIEGRENPDSVLLVTEERTNFVGLKLRDVQVLDRLVVKSPTAHSGLLQPPIDGIPGQLLDARDCRLVHPFDTQGHDIVEDATTMLTVPGRREFPLSALEDVLISYAEVSGYQRTLFVRQC